MLKLEENKLTQEAGKTYAQQTACWVFSIGEFERNIYSIHSVNQTL